MGTVSGDSRCCSKKKLKIIEFKVDEKDLVIKFTKKNRDRLPTLFKEYAQVLHEIEDLKKEDERLQNKRSKSKRTEYRLKEIRTELERTRKKKHRCKDEVEVVIKDKNFTHFNSKRLDVLAQYFGAL